jgi:hypothetical protein
MDKKVSGLLYLLFGVLLVAGAALHIAEKAFAPYIFSVGAVGLIVLKVNSLKNAPISDFRVRRLNNIQAIAAVLLILSAYLMFVKNNFWALALIISAVFDLVVVFRMPEDKAENK